MINYLIMLRKCPLVANRYNGYVAFDKYSPWYKDEHVTYSDYGRIECNGGITYAEHLHRDDLKNFDIIKGDTACLEENVIVIGFDTVHGWDTDEMWPKEKVIAEAENISEQLKTMTKEEALENLAVLSKEQLREFGFTDEELDRYYSEMAEEDPDMFKHENF